jgi:lysyl-tRNA synthetase, class II
MNGAMVESTTLSSLAYDEALELLQLEFRNGSIYQYFGVPATVHEALRNAPSKGSYFNRAIRGRFPHALVAIARPSRVGRV